MTISSATALRSFLIFTGQAGEQRIEARYEDETVWLSQRLMATLFKVEVPTIHEHLKADRDVLKDGGKISAQSAREFAESEFEKFRIVQDRLFESDFDRALKQPASGLMRNEDENNES